LVLIGCVAGLLSAALLAAAIRSERHHPEFVSEG
jgi:hypothetical protein